jgi:hypothetical protein
LFTNTIYSRNNTVKLEFSAQGAHTLQWAQHHPLASESDVSPLIIIAIECENH